MGRRLVGNREDRYRNLSLNFFITPRIERAIQRFFVLQQSGKQLVPDSAHRPGTAAGLIAALWLLSAPTFAAADNWLPPEVTARASDAGTYYLDANGKALYTFAQDNMPGKSACNKECPNVWPPLTAPKGATPQDAWTTIARDDGSHQWALDNRPLYRYVRDVQPGSALGDRVGNAWNVAYVPVRVPPGLAIRALFPGRTLVDGRGHTIYTRGDNKDCDRACLKVWTPVTAPLLAAAIGDFTAVAQSDGTPQWAYRGKRLFLNVNDPKAGAMLGHGADRAWRAVVLEAAAPLPKWITLQNSDWGEVYADERGMTLYTHVGDLKKVTELMCLEACMSVWRNVTAKPDDAAAGEWNPTQSPDGGLRWAYKGEPVFVHTRDKVPGAIGGDKWAAGSGAGRGFQPIVVRRDYEED